MVTRTLLLFGVMLTAPFMTQAQVVSGTVPATPPVAFTGTPVPLLSLDALQFLQGTWTATSRDGLTPLGSYSFIRELNGHILSRQSVVDPNCKSVSQPACGRRDLFYVYQESAGAPLRAISFDSEGHVIHYLASLATQGFTSNTGRRDLVIFDSDPAQLGPRVRLRYEHNVDLQTGKEALNGAFELLQPDGTYLDLQQWYGIRK